MQLKMVTEMTKEKQKKKQFVRKRLRHKTLKTLHSSKFQKKQKQDQIMCVITS